MGGIMVLFHITSRIWEFLNEIVIIAG